MAEKQRINTLKARSKNKKIREYDSRTKRDVEYQISRRPLPFVELTKDRDLAVLETVSNLLLKGATFSEIREIVLKEHDKDFSIDQIKKYRDTCHKIWVNELTANFDEVLSKDLARIDYQERVLWEALEESKNGKRKIHTEKTNSSGQLRGAYYSFFLCNTVLKPLILITSLLLIKKTFLPFSFFEQKRKSSQPSIKSFNLSTKFSKSNFKIVYTIFD